MFRKARVTKLWQCQEPRCRRLFTSPIYEKYCYDHKQDDERELAPYVLLGLLVALLVGTFWGWLSLP